MGGWGNAPGASRLRASKAGSTSLKANRYRKKSDKDTDPGSLISETVEGNMAVKWPVYRFGLEATSKERHEGSPSVEVTPKLLSEALREIMFNDMLQSQQAQQATEKDYVHHESMGFLALLAERDWLVSGKPTLFVESAELVQQIYACGVKLDYEGICLPGDVLAISFPEDTVVEGFPLPPCLFHKAFVPAQLSVSGTDHVRYGITIRSGFGIHEVSGVRCQEHLDQVLKGNCEPSWTGWGETVLDSEERRRMAVLFRLVLGLSAYLSAFPETIRAGFPTAIKARDLKALKRTLSEAPPSVLTQHSKFRNTPSAHFRTWFFRTLRDERYRRNPDGSFRTVFVSPTFVGGKDLDPSTVEKLRKECST